MAKTFYEKTLDFNFITKFLHAHKNKILFKYLNNFDKNKKITFLDIGCGPGHIFPELLKFSKNIEYTGIDIRSEFIEEANKRYSKYSQFKSFKIDCEEYIAKMKEFDVIISFDTFEHIPLDKRNNIINLLNNYNFKLLLVNVPNEVGPAILLKNLGSFMMGYFRYKEYKVSETLYSTFYLIDKIEPHYDGHKGFDWRMLYYTLRYFYNVNIFTSPFKFIPKIISPTIFFACTKQNKINLRESIINNAREIKKKYGFNLDDAIAALEDNNNNIALSVNFLKNKK